MNKRSVGAIRRFSHPKAKEVITDEATAEAPCGAVLCLLAGLSLLPMTALAATRVTIDSQFNSEGFDYFEYYNADGRWVDLNTPKHTIVETGQIAYCIQHKLGNPHGVGYSEIDPLDSYSTRTVRGIQIILENGYPCTTNGFTDDQARQATANAIRFWLSEEGADSQWNFTNRKNNPNLVRAKSGYQSLLDWADELLQMARNQQLLSHSVSFSPASMELTVSGDYFVGSTKVTLQNCSGGYTLDKSSLPPDTIVTGFTGKNGDTLTIKVPKNTATRAYGWTPQATTTAQPPTCSGMHRIPATTRKSSPILPATMRLRRTGCSA